MTPQRRGKLVKYNLTRMNENPYEHRRFQVVRKTQGTLQENKNDNHFKLWSLPTDSSRPLFKQIDILCGILTVYFNSKYFS